VIRHHRQSDTKMAAKLDLEDKQLNGSDDDEDDIDDHGVLGQEQDPVTYKIIFFNHHQNARSNLVRIFSFPRSMNDETHC
jgi:hypothetical protein